MNFKSTIEGVAKVLEKHGTKININDFDGIIIKRLEASNTLDPGRKTRQSHIAITGQQMDMFPYVRADGYFEIDYDKEDPELKKYFTALIPAYLHKTNTDYLDDDNIIMNNDEELVHISIVRSRRNNAADQIQMSMTNMDSPLFVSFRRIVHAGSYLIFLKRAKVLMYDVYAVKPSDIAVDGFSLSDCNNCFCKLPTNTPVKIDELIPLEDTGSGFENEYQRAASIIQEYITETGFVIPEDKESIEQALAYFSDLFSPEKLEALTDDNLLQTIFYTSGDNSNALCYWLESKKEYRNLFGSIAGGSAYKFGLFQKKEDGIWYTGSPQKPQKLSDAEALVLGKQIRDALVNGANLIRSAELNSIADYEQLDVDIKSAVGEQLYNLAWVHKYFAMICPDKLSGFHSTEWQCHALRCLKIKPSEKYYVRSGQLSMIENYAEMYYREFFSVLYDKFGGIKQFVRIGTSDGTNNYTLIWKQRSVVGIGWKELGPLTDYVLGDSLDRNAIDEKLTEVYYMKDERTASRKAGEIVRFYKTTSDSIFVPMDGEKLIALVDEIGDYFYDGSSEMSHLKPGKWHSVFDRDAKLPTKAEGKLTTCYPLTNEDNLMFLYDKYYYGSNEEVDEGKFDSETFSEEEDNVSEEKNKRLFRYWMSMQVKPEGDTDAGQPYSKTSIDQYVSNIANTPLPMNPGKSVFYTTRLEQVQVTIDALENMEKKNNTQKSAVRKYMQFLIAMKEGNMSPKYRTSIESKYERNRILFGAPGTGKSFALKKDSEECLNGTSGTMERVTFHPDYTYSQFVGTYKPVSDEGSIKYEFIPGPFMRVFVDAVKSAMSDEPQPHILVIEEINRAKVAAVFGDVFQLLDRDDDGVSEYDIQTSEDIRKYLAKELGGKPNNYSRIRIPNNMFIWATMNSADQGVFPMDTAFKRRWNFEYLGINQNEAEICGKIVLGKDVTQCVYWNALRRAINEKLAKEYKVNEDKLMGPFFLSKKVTRTISETDDTIADTDRFIEIFKSKVIMYLYEDAAKQHKHKLFSGCEDTTKYSAVCDSFDRIGIQIFGEDFEETYYKPQEEAQEG